MNIISLESSRLKTKRRKAKSFYPEAGGKPIIINREKIMGTILRVLNNTKDINLGFMALRGDTTYEEWGYLSNPIKCWKMVDFLTKEIIEEMDKFLKIMTTKRPGTTSQNMPVENTVAINRHDLAVITKRILGNIQEIRTISSFIQGSKSKASLFSYEKDISKSWSLLTSLTDSINAQTGKLLAAIPTKKIIRPWDCKVVSQKRKGESQSI